MIKTILLSTALVGAVLALLLMTGAQDRVLDLLRWIEAQGALGPLLFMLVMALVVVLLVPGVMFTAGAGFAFGVIEGSVVVVLGTTLGATLAFLLARYGFGRCAEVFLGRHERLRAISNDLGEAGWKVVLMTRMVPFFPFKLSNYAFGLTRVSLGLRLRHAGRRDPALGPQCLSRRDRRRPCHSRAAERRADSPRLAALRPGVLPGGRERGLSWCAGAAGAGAPCRCRQKPARRRCPGLAGCPGASCCAASPRRMAFSIR